MNLFKKVFGKLDATDKSGLINMSLKPLSLILSVIYTPLLLNYLGDEKYGLWSTILSVINWVNYFDVGIGQGLRNLLTKELTEKQYEKARRSISTAYMLLSGIAGLIFIVGFVFIYFFDLNFIFNTDIEIKLPVIISFIFIIINFVLTLSNTILYALQLSEKVSILSFLTQVLNIIGIILLNIFTSANLVWMALLFGSSTLVVYIIKTVHIFLRNKELRPSIYKFDKSKISAIGSEGMKFFIIHIAMIMLYTVDNLLITHYFGAKEVTPFHVVDKAFSIVYSFLSALLIPYWSKTTQMLQLGDVQWVKKSIKKVRCVLGVFIFGYILLAVVFKPLAAMWIGKDLSYQKGLIGSMLLYYIFYSIVTTHTPFINGSGKINAQLILTILMGIINIPLSIILAVNCNMGVVGIKLATALLMVVAAVFYPINLHIIIKKQRKKISINKQE